MAPIVKCACCGRRREHYARALCRACYTRTYQRERWAALPDLRARRRVQMREARLRRLGKK